jgi:competence protein ComEC
MIALPLLAAGLAAVSYSFRAIQPKQAVHTDRREPLAAPNEPGNAGAEAHWELTLFDVGTGLSLLLRGPDFTLLYDGGSNDDRETGPSNRLLAYLDAAVGRSGSASCREGDGTTYPERPLTHVFLSHPHRDHVGLLPDVIRCYRVGHIWDSGAISDTAAYGAFLSAASRERDAVYHSARGAPPNRTIAVAHRTHALPSWSKFREGDTIPLGFSARATILSARMDDPDVNDASIVLRIDLGQRSVLLTGDSTAGPRSAPSDEPGRGSVEDHLLRMHRTAIDVDVLQVAHHGSKTSSRASFLDAVSPAWALLSSGPAQYGGVTLPDAAVVDALLQRGVRLLRTDVADRECALRPQKVGKDADGKPGGCSAARLRIAATGEIVQVAPAAKDVIGDPGG